MNDIDLIKCKFNDYKCTDSYVFSAIENIELQLKLLEKLQETLYSAELYLVYMHTSPDGKIYIGITKNLPNARWNEGAGYETQKKFYKAIQTFGWINFKHEIIAAGLSENEAKELESKLILKYRSNEEKYGYNTQVNRSALEKPQEKGEKYRGRANFNNTDIANKLVESFSIKTIDGVIYYLKDKKYITEKEYPVIKKELLLTYKIESRRQKEIIEQIKILSHAKREDVFPADDMQADVSEIIWTSDISSFFYNLVFEEKSGYFISDNELYDTYMAWGRQLDVDIVPRSEFVRKSALWMSIYRPDIERIVTSSRIGWEMRPVILEENSGNVVTVKGIKVISQWLEDSQETVVCVPMICERALGLKIKGSRKLGNEICFAMRNVIPGWKDMGVVRTREYGNQLCFVRK